MNKTIQFSKNLIKEIKEDRVTGLAKRTSLLLFTGTIPFAHITAVHITLSEHRYSDSPRHDKNLHACGNDGSHREKYHQHII